MYIYYSASSDIYTISDVVSFDERPLVVHAELGRAEDAAERTPSLARTTQAAR